MEYEYIANRTSKVIHRVIYDNGRYWRSGCDVQNDNEDVFAGIDDAVEALKEHTRCSKCWPAEGFITFSSDSATQTITTDINFTTGGAEHE